MTDIRFISFQLSRYAFISILPLSMREVSSTVHADQFLKMAVKQERHRYFGSSNRCNFYQEVSFCGEIFYSFNFFLAALV